MEVENLSDLEIDVDYIELRIQRLKQERDYAASQIVGTSYWNEVAQEKKKELQLLLNK